MNAKDRHDENQQADAWLRIVRHPVIASVPVPRDGRSFVEAVMDHLTDLHEEVERLTRERDEWQARHAALRGAVVTAEANLPKETP